MDPGCLLAVLLGQGEGEGGVKVQQEEEPVEEEAPEQEGAGEWGEEERGGGARRVLAAGRDGAVEEETKAHTQNHLWRQGMNEG